MYDREERKAVRQMTCKEAQRLVIPYIRASRQQIYQVRMLTIARYAADTLAVLCIAVMLMLQARLWWQNGIF